MSVRSCWLHPNVQYHGAWWVLGYRIMKTLMLICDNAESWSPSVNSLVIWDITRPADIFETLTAIYGDFDALATLYNVFKVYTIGVWWQLFPFTILLAYSIIEGLQYWVLTFRWCLRCCCRYPEDCAQTCLCCCEPCNCHHRCGRRWLLVSSENLFHPVPRSWPYRPSVYGERTIPLDPTCRCGSVWPPGQSSAESWVSPPPGMLLIMLEILGIAWIQERYWLH